VKKPEYLKQELDPKKGIKKLEVEMFSRATHFREIPIAIEDSLRINEKIVLERPLNIVDSASADVATSNDIEEFK
jgi:hypothetical protein